MTQNCTENDLQVNECGSDDGERADQRDTSQASGALSPAPGCDYSECDTEREENRAGHAVKHRERPLIQADSHPTQDALHNHERERGESQIADPTAVFGAP